MARCQRCKTIVDFAHWNGKEQVLCDKCVKYLRDEQIKMEIIRRTRM